MHPLVSWLLLAFISFGLGYGAVELYRALFPSELTQTQQQPAPGVVPAQE